MADNVAITSGSGTTIAADEVSDGTLGSVKVQFVKLMDGTLDGTSKAAVGTNGLKVEQIATTVGDGRKVVTTAGTAVQFSSQACRYVILTGLEANTDMVVIGGSGIVASASTRTGITLTALQNVRLDISNMNLLYMDSVVNGEGVTFAYFS